MEPDLSVLLIERSGWEKADYDAWSTRNAVAGTVLSVHTRWQGRPVLRFCFVKPATNVVEVASVLDDLAVGSGLESFGSK